MHLVILETPYSGEVERNLKYARLCAKDCIRRGESPYASHLLLTQPHILDDNDQKEREQGIYAGHQWMLVADYVVAYTDFGISEGMQAGIERAKYEGKNVYTRKLPETVMISHFAPDSLEDGAEPCGDCIKFNGEWRCTMNCFDPAW